MDPHDKVLTSLRIPLQVPVMMHDFAITEHYSVLLDLPYTFRKERMALGQPALQFEPERASRFGIMPRHLRNTSEIRWFKTPACFMFHTANSYEQGDEVVLVGMRTESTTSFTEEPPKNWKRCTPHALLIALLSFAHRLLSCVPWVQAMSRTCTSGASICERAR